MAFWGDLVSLCDYFVAVKGRYSLTFGARWLDLLLYLPFLALSLFLLHLGVLGIYGSLTLGPSPYLFLPSPICPLLSTISNCTLWQRLLLLPSDST